MLEPSNFHYLPSYVRCIPFKFFFFALLFFFGFFFFFVWTFFVFDIFILLRSCYDWEMKNKKQNERKNRRTKLLYVPKGEMLNECAIVMRHMKWKAQKKVTCEKGQCYKAIRYNFSALYSENNSTFLSILSQMMHALSFCLRPLMDLNFQLHICVLNEVLAKETHANHFGKINWDTSNAEYDIFHFFFHIDKVFHAVLWIFLRLLF